MSVPVFPENVVPEETVRVARAAFPKGNVFMKIRDELGLICTNPRFESLSSHTGQPSEDPVRLALVSVMQFAEGLSHRQAARCGERADRLEIRSGIGAD